VLGIVVSSAHIFIWVLYFTIEIYVGMNHFQGKQHPVVLGFLISLGVLFYVLLPGWVLHRECVAATNDTSTSDSHELLMEGNVDDASPFLSKYGFDAEGTGDSALSNGFNDPRNRGSRGKGRKSDSSMEQILAMNASDYPGSSSQHDNDNSSTASTRSFLLTLGSDTSSTKAATDFQLYRAKAASAFAVGGSTHETVGNLLPPSHVPLYADMMPPDMVTPSKARLALHGNDDDDAEFKDTDDAPAGYERRTTPPQQQQQPFSGYGIALPRDRSPFSLRSPAAVAPAQQGGDTPAGESAESSRGVLSLYQPAGSSTPGGGSLMLSSRPVNIGSVSASGMSTHGGGSYLRQRSIAPLKPRTPVPSGKSSSLTRRSGSGSGSGDSSGNGAAASAAAVSDAIASGLTNQVANATAALDPNRILPMLMKLGVSSVEAAGMMTYLMRMKELGEGRKRKNSLAMVV
jgi:hypothetical protein